MDIPNTGAIFTLGKSHLAENAQSYFYIKNDPIKRLVAGPFQSAVICESGRLFVWGENHHGQLGVVRHPSNSNNNNNNNDNNKNEDIIVKPTCVKSLKTLGLKIADVSFGSDWSIILTISNELYFTGRNIFRGDCTVATNFTEATVNEETCKIIRKPFRLEEFDDCLLNNGEAENFIKVLAGNEHFVLLTSFGRLIGWGSNEVHQLGSSNDTLLKPHEIVLGSPIQQCTCGPESTLVLTNNGKLYLTGRINEFKFSNFTELQKNLASNEQITFMNISKASEIFIVTNAGSIYRSYESVRNKSLVFQRFYDYDSEENGPICKMLKGASFYGVLTKANKFYTTFSESGHHLKTFREISKFKNLRILDISLGDRHILVHGVPRSSVLAATIGSSTDRHIIQSLIMSNSIGDLSNTIKGGNKTSSSYTSGWDIANNNVEKSTEEKLNKNQVDLQNKRNRLVKTTKNKEEEDNNSNVGINEFSVDLSQNKNDIQESEESFESFATDNTVISKKSPESSLTSNTSSQNSLTKNNIETATGGIRTSVRPRTPFPESSSRSSPPPNSRRTPIRNFSYEAAVNNNSIQHAPLTFEGNLKNIPEFMVKDTGNLPDLTVSNPTPPTEDDEELQLEISEITDPLDHTVTVNEIRFINNGIDVTANVKRSKSDGSDDSLDVAEEEYCPENKADNDTRKKLAIKEAESFIDGLEEEIENTLKVTTTKQPSEEDLLKPKAPNFADKSESKFSETRYSIENEVMELREGVDSRLTETKKTAEIASGEASTVAREDAHSITENREKVSKIANSSLAKVSNYITNANDGTNQIESKVIGDTKESMNNAIRKVAGDTKQAVGSITSKISTEVQDTKYSISSMFHGKKNKVDVQKPKEQIDDFQYEATSKVSNNTTTPSNNATTGVQEDDERTTASANSNHSASAGNPFESTIPFDAELDAMVQRGKQALREELEAASAAVENNTERIIDEVQKEKSTFSKFLDDLKEKSKSLSCRNEKGIRIFEDKPPRYSEEDEIAMQAVSSTASGSKVCTIL